MWKAFFRKHLLYITLIIAILSAKGRVYAEETPLGGPILIISSYNPETSQTSNNISSFLDEYKALGGKLRVIIENMNCKSFTESPRWKQLMTDILNKYSGKNTPRLLILMGQEAWSAFLSQNDSDMRSIPVIGCMVSRNAVILPDSTVDLENWVPESIDAFDDVKNCNIVAGYSYDYDVKGNVELIKQLYPKTEHIAFISDNSYGGVSMQALVREEMKEKFPDMDLILLDGRKHTIYTITNAIADLPENSAILVGTWRVDMNDGYSMRNATYAMKDANSKTPAFTMASLGLGHWVLGGYVPQYRTVGADIAHQVVNFFDKTKKDEVTIEFIPNHYVFDMLKLKENGLANVQLPPNSDFVNKEVPFVEKYKYQIIGVGTVFVVLLVGLFVSLYFFLHTKRLKDELLESEAELRVAKDRAEESSRLKTAFLANMSHEIRTPLNAIVGFSNVLASGGNSDEDQKKYFEIIQSNSDLLLHLINDILDISRLESGRIKFFYEKCDIVPLCERMLSTAQYARKTEAEFVLDVPVELFEITTDVQRLQQVLINLLSNASKFTPKGTITLSFEVKPLEGMVYFMVTDTGCGIPPAKRELVFERFEKLNEYAQGTGLGLSICKLTVERLGGEIWVDPNYNDGARFIFSHPIEANPNVNDSE